MRRWEGWDGVPGDLGGTAVTMGVFDGVHRGHQYLIDLTVRRAGERGLRSVVVTFEPNPLAVLAPGKEPPLLTTLDRKAELIGARGVDALWIIPFTREFSLLNPEEFLQEVVVDRLGAAEVLVGENFRFGHKAAGDLATLRAVGTRAGYTTEGVPLQDGWSSTLVRTLLTDGDVEGAARALGREYRLEGTVVRGKARGGSALGYPTANIGEAKGLLLPADGVYAGWLVRGEERLPAAISVGTNPTFDDEGRRAEAYVLDFDGDLYDQWVGVDFTARLRGQVKFDSVDALLVQMAEDVKRTRELLT
ncbi:MAG: bifunctional riboflavin kinase/FAD synthetase [Mycobacteriales bacterium]